MASTTQLNSFTDTTLAQHSVNNVNNCVLAPSRSTADCSAGKFVLEPDVSNCITSITFNPLLEAPVSRLISDGASLKKLKITQRVPLFKLLLVVGTGFLCFFFKNPVLLNNTMLAAHYHLSAQG